MNDFLVDKFLPILAIFFLLGVVGVYFTTLIILINMLLGV